MKQIIKGDINRRTGSWGEVKLFKGKWRAMTAAFIEPRDHVFHLNKVTGQVLSQINYVQTSQE